VTLVAAGVADNVLPQTAEVSLNFRLLPGAPPNTTLQYVRGWLGPDAAHANISLVETGMPPSEVTDARSEGFQVLKAAIQAVWRLQDGASGSRPVPVLPYLMPGGTDSKHYTRLGAARSILRFSPLFLAPEDLSLVHGTNERIAVDDFVRLLCTYKAGLRLAGDAAGSSSSSSSVAAV
jgi:carboxypeptidase PM20D1